MSTNVKFRWVGRNRKFGDITINENLTTATLLSGDYQSFFSEPNRRKDGNCEFLSEDLFSGLVDIDGKNVYEGDIIMGYEAKDDGGLEMSKYKVEYEDFGFVAISLQGKCDSWLFHFNNDPNQTPNAACKVIGNIYENPELLIENKG